MNIDPETLFRALADTTRQRCMVLLQQEGELCVCELTHALDAAQPKISRHLAHLREARLVSDRRDGLWIHYRLNPTLPEWVQSILRATAEGVTATEPFASDKAALARMPDRPFSRDWA